MKKKLGPFRKYLYKGAEDYVTIHAAYSTLFIFLSIFPLSMFLMASLTFLGIGRDYLIANLSLITPAAFHDFIRNIIENSYENANSFVLSVSAVIAVWTSSSGVYGIMFGLNDVYRTYDTRSYLKRRALCILYTFAMLIMVSLSLLLLVFGNRLEALLVGKFTHLMPFFRTISRLKYPVIYVILTLLFNLIYHVFPNIKTGFFIHTPGALFSAGGWLLLSYFYSVYVNSPYVFTLYGSFATIILFLFWLFLLMCIIFLGGEINAFILDRKYGTDTSDFRTLHLQQIRDVESGSGRKLTKEERYTLRKSTTRKIEAMKMLEEEKERQKEKPS